MRACCDDAHVKDECGFFGSNEEKDHHLGVYEDGYESFINIGFVNKRLQNLSLPSLSDNLVLLVRVLSVVWCD